MAITVGGDVDRRVAQSARHDLEGADAPRRSNPPDLFQLTITVPKGLTFTAFMRREDLFDAYRCRCGG
jgi:hypothetical protein